MNFKNEYEHKRTYLAGVSVKSTHDGISHTLMLSVNQAKHGGNWLSGAECLIMTSSHLRGNVWKHFGLKIVDKSKTFS